MGKNRNRLAGTFLALLLLALPGAPSAAERRGVELTITLKDGHYLGGELIAVKPDSLLLLTGKDESVDLIGIRSIRIVRKSKARLGGVYGFLAGTFIMVIANALDPHGVGAGEAIGLGMFFGGIPVGSIGLGVGAIAGTDKTIQFEGKSESEVRKALAYLRKKARIRNHK